jgi:ATP-dependent Clp protease ATP-binding subunit ClpB
MTLRKSKYETMNRLMRPDAQRELRPETFVRITPTVVFNKLDYDAQGAIAGGLNETAGMDARRFAQINLRR